MIYNSNDFSNTTEINKHDDCYKECIIEPLRIIEDVLPTNMYAGFLLGNIIKYRLRAGHKGSASEDIDKALNYERLYKELKNKKDDEE